MGEYLHMCFTSLGESRAVNGELMVIARKESVFCKFYPNT